MPANCNRTTYRTQQTSTLSQLSSCAALCGEDEELIAEEEPMRRYPHPIPMSSSAAAETSEDSSPSMTRVLEQLSCQSQLLVDLLGAVNSLTAALLTRDDKN